MHVYGDGQRRERPRAKLARVQVALRRAAAAPTGIARHALWIEALIEAGELLQGVADAVGDEALGRCDDDALVRCDDDAVDGATALALALAHACLHSWRHGFAAPPDVDVRTALARCAGLGWPAWIDVRRCEGYAFYALYPEGHGMAALAASASGAMQGGGHSRVLGLRSIGTSLAAMVAAGLDAPRFDTLRPAGHPFARTAAALPPGPAHDAAVVDEGPGLSGSSFAAGLGALVQAGVAPSRVHLFPSHPHGPGAQASDAARALWRTQPVHAVGIDALIGGRAAPPQRLLDWVRADLPGPVAPDWLDVGGGRWRSLHGDMAGRLPAQPQMERLKFLLPAQRGGGAWLLRFAGLGRAGRAAFARRRVLAAAGFGPSVQGLWHGFTAERWLPEARPLPLWAAAQSPPRAWLVDRLADYLAFRARHLPAPAQAGASLATLVAMAHHNIAQGLGEAAAPAWAAWCGAWPAAMLAAPLRRVQTDNRLHAWEWLWDGERLRKADAVDHAHAHDLVGCQPIAWDVAGALAEFALDADERQRLLHRMRAQGCALQPDLLALCEPLYAAFQLGAFTLAAQSAPPADAPALHTKAAGYAQALKLKLGLKGAA
ncbi:hypothetical protein [Pseudacidovorax intermedius]|uniref:Uncharacterized protein n=1 Tax=Pseudacidovorax intermedius TaxID=433924 RepID=A0A147H5G2_9BURK|nr:hypothetical protein [Pseudacidovorax intermedius]KTT25115.1 hypothetical protein NS331_05410 [Pseudacidovorax intermedius]